MHYIDLILYRSLADLRTEARRYYISYFWWIFEPVLDMLIFYFVFGLLLKRAHTDYVPFLLIGVLSWKWFNTTVMHCSNSILGSKGIINQVNIPKFVFPLIVICTDTFKFLIVFTIIIVFVNIYGFTIGSAYIFLPLLLIAQLLFIVALGTLFAAITPFFPDIFIILSHVLHLMFFCSGIFFEGRTLPADFQFWFYLNPMAWIIESYREILMHNHFPGLPPLLAILSISVALTIFSFRFIQHHDKTYPRIVLQ